MNRSWPAINSYSSPAVDAYWSSKHAARRGSGFTSAPTTSSSIAPRISRAPGKKRTTVANPCAIVAAPERRSVSGSALPETRFQRRAVQWIDQQSPAAILLSGAARKHERLGESLRDEANGLVAREGGEPAHERLFAHAIDGIDRVAGIARCGRELLRRLPRACLHDGIADRGMQGLDWLQQTFRARHFSSHRRPFAAASSSRRRLITPPPHRAAASSRRPSPPFV